MLNGWCESGRVQKDTEAWDHPLKNSNMTVENVVMAPGEEPWSDSLWQRHKLIVCLKKHRASLPFRHTSSFIVNCPPIPQMNLDKARQGSENHSRWQPHEAGERSVCKAKGGACYRESTIENTEIYLIIFCLLRIFLFCLWRHISISSVRNHIHPFSIPAFFPIWVAGVCWSRPQLSSLRNRYMRHV